MSKKIKVLVISDHYFAPSGVAIQSKYVVDSLLDSGKFKVIYVGGAVKHQDYRPIKVDKYGDDLVVIPVDGYGTQDLVRQIVRQEKIDMMWIMTDPRQFIWLFEVENEIRQYCPIIYNHLWDAKPTPLFLKPLYRSVDVIVTISKLSNEIVKEVVPELELHHIPHSIDYNIFKKLPKHEVEKFKKSSFGDKLDDRFVFFWNARNARRKQPGSLIFWYKAFLNKVGRDKAMLIMHTDVKDPNGQDLGVIVRDLGLTNNEIMFSEQKLPPEYMNYLYNVADCFISVSDAEGFGCPSLEALTAETPIIVTMTGGMQEQVTDGKQWFGVGLEPASKAVIGSQGQGPADVPYIYEDRVCEKDVVNAMTTMYTMPKEQREELGRLGRQHSLTNYNFDECRDRWVKLMEDVYSRHGSWDTRKLFSPVKVTEV